MLAQERQVAKPNLEGAGTCNTPGVQGAGGGAETGLAGLSGAQGSSEQ